MVIAPPYLLKGYYYKEVSDPNHNVQGTGHPVSLPNIYILSTAGFSAIKVYDLALQKI
jgi:hypothetical protein